MAFGYSALTSGAFWYAGVMYARKPPIIPMAGTTHIVEMPNAVGGACA